MKEEMGLSSADITTASPKTPVDPHSKLTDQGKDTKFSTSLRLLSFLLLVFIILIGVFYKYFEWKVISELADLYNSSEIEELALIEEIQNISFKSFELLDEIYALEAPTLEDSTGAIDKYQGQNRLLVNSHENYSKTMNRNLNEYRALEKKVRFLFGARGKFAQDLIREKIRYYENELANNEDSLVAMSLLINTYNLEKDRLISQNYLDLTTESETYYSERFSDLAVLKKYTNKNFKFENGEKIKELYPYGYRTLENLKNFLSSLYNLVKDYVAEDYESVAYKASRLEEDILELGVDYDRLFQEGNERQLKRSEDIMSSTINVISAIDNFEENDLGRYPVLEEINYWKEDLVACQIYSYKTGLYKDITDRYPEADDFESLLSEIGQISPKTNSIDQAFNRDTVSYSNTEENITFECSDQDSGRTYTYILQKPQSETEAEENI